jgi:hypothetical protein
MSQIAKPLTIYRKRRKNIEVQLIVEIACSKKYKTLQIRSIQPITKAVTLDHPSPSKNSPKSVAKILIINIQLPTD